MVYRRKTRVVKKTKSVKKVALDKEIKKVVKQELKVEAELKHVDFGPITFNQYQVGSTSWGNTGIFTVSPDNAGGTTGCVISQGVAQNQRIGNAIRIKKAFVQYSIYVMPYDAVLNPTPMPVFVQVIFYSDKSNPTSTPATSSTNINGIWQDGNGSSALSGTLTDLIERPNKDIYTIHKIKYHKIGYQYNRGTGSTAGVNNQYYSNTDFHMNSGLVKVDCTKWMTKSVKFNDNFANCTPKLLVAFNIIRSSGSPVVATEYLTRMSLHTSIDYTDM